MYITFIFLVLFPEKEYAFLYLFFLFFAQVLNGDVENAICLHAFYYAIWKRFGALPERYNWQLQAPDVLFYPLRPELVESTYLLYQVQTFLSGRSALIRCIYKYI